MTQWIAGTDSCGRSPSMSGLRKRTRAPYTVDAVSRNEERWGFGKIEGTREDARRDGGLHTHLAALASVALTVPDVLMRLEPIAATIAAYMVDLMTGEGVAQSLVHG